MSEKIEDYFRIGQAVGDAWSNHEQFEMYWVVSIVLPNHYLWTDGKVRLGASVDERGSGWFYTVSEIQEAFEKWLPTREPTEAEQLKTALADAIRRPTGVVPESAEKFVTGEMLEAAEERRPKILDSER